MLNQNIKEFRIERGLTQAQLAEMVGATQGAVYFWEKGINEPTAGYLIKLARIFSVSVDELLSFESDQKGDGSSKVAEMNRYFTRLTGKQQEMLINIARELINT